MVILVVSIIAVRVGSLALRKTGVLGITRENVGYIGSPHGGTRILKGDVLTVYGQDEPVRDVLCETGVECPANHDSPATEGGGGGTEA